MSLTVTTIESPRPAVLLAPLTSLKVGGPADFYVTVREPHGAGAALRWAAERGLTCRWLGGGSNLLVAEAGVSGLVARYLGDRLTLPDAPGEPVVCEAGRGFLNLARSLARAGWGGLEWAANVPGSVGGAVVNNAGAFGSCVAECLIWAELVRASGELERLAVGDLDYAYRTSRLKRHELRDAVVVRAAFRVHPTESDAAQARIREIQRQRNASQPRQLSAGSVFANPPDDYAGRLIESAGLKGRQIGGASISTQHANFIVSSGQATADQVYQLIRLAQDRVWQTAAVWLRPEIELLGRWTNEQLDALRAPGGPR
jgi:UDP-N-acetylmuramate dehydrogenase